MVPPVERQGRGPAQTGLHSRAHEFVRSGPQEPVEVAAGTVFYQVGADLAASPDCSRNFAHGALTAAAPTLSIAGNVDLLQLAFLTVLAASCVGPGGRRRYRRKPRPCVRTRGPPFTGAMAAQTILKHRTDTGGSPTMRPLNCVYVHLAGDGQSVLSNYVDGHTPTAHRARSHFSR